MTTAMTGNSGPARGPRRKGSTGERCAYLVLGMHRSGTSATSSGLQLDYSASTNPGVNDWTAPASGAKVYASVDGGFISVANDRVSILAEHISLGQEIDAAQARADLESAKAAAGANAEFDAGVLLAQARLDAALKAS